MKNKIPKNAKRVFKGKIFEVFQWKQKMFDGSYQIFEKIKRPDTAIMIPSVGNKILLTYERQPNNKKFALSFPSGRCEPNEAPLNTAKRELLEETGCVSKNWQLWTQIKPDSNKIVWSIYVYIARDCKKVAEQKLDVGEKITPKLISLEKLMSIADSQEFFAGSVINMINRLKLYPKEKAKFKKALFG